LAAIEEAVDRVGGRAVVVGLSLGGYLGIAHAARRPDQVAGLVAAGCSSVPDQPATAAWLLAARCFARLPDRGAWLNQRLVDTTLPPEGAQAVADGGFALEVMVDLLSAMRRVDIVGDLRRIACPVWLVNGRWDHFRLQERLFLAAARDGHLVTVRGATHLVNLVRPVAFNRVLLEALDCVDAGEASAELLGVRQGPGPHAPDEAGGVGHHDDVVPHHGEDSRPDASGVPAAEVEAVPLEHRA
jgi:pimeloyl-ACP methyl ester carboxylesterase